MGSSRLSAFLFVAVICFGFQSDKPAAVAASTPGVINPVVARRQEPRYSEEARSSGISGIVALQIVVDEQGRATDVEVLSPLGYGLDENAIAAVVQWRFRPGTKNGKPVKVQAVVEITFRLSNTAYDAKTERERTAFNLLLHELQENKFTPATVQRAQELASKKYPPGMYLYGKMLEEGRGLTASPEEGFRLIQEAAGRRYGLAMYEVGLARLTGERLEKDPAKGLDLMRGAAKFGSRSAQWYLGQAYEAGDGVSVDFEKSREYLRLCASAGGANCQFRLGRSLLQHSDRPDRDYVQAIAWLELASDQKVEDAEKILEKEDERLTPAQAAGAIRLKAQLAHKP